jgi:hypothetical protein
MAMFRNEDVFEGVLATLFANSGHLGLSANFLLLQFLVVLLGEKNMQFYGGSKSHLHPAGGMCGLQY